MYTINVLAAPVICPLYSHGSGVIEKVKICYEWLGSVAVGVYRQWGEPHRV